MKALGIRGRLLLAALGPALMLAILVSVLLVWTVAEQVHMDQHRRLAAISRQISALAAYDLFIGNREGLRKLVDTVLKEADIVAVTILDRNGQIAASSLPADRLPSRGEIIDGYATPVMPEQTEHWHGLPILAGTDISDDLFDNRAGSARPLGHLLLKVSNAGLQDEIRLLVLKAAGISGSLLLCALLLALILSRKIIETLDDIRDVVDGVGHGRLDLRVQLRGNDELGQLAAGINRMAESVSATQEQLATRVAEATASLRQERDAAEHASRARSRFFAAASHDLRQPVQALGLFAARLEHDAGHSPLRPGIHQVAESVRNLQALLNSLLEYSRLDGQSIEVRLRPTQTHRLVLSVAEDFAAAAAEKQLSLRVIGRDCWVMTDPTLLRRILINLIGNAVRYTRTGGILVACRRAGSHVRIEVWDTGPGIPADQQEAIFEELIQLENPERDSEKGLGLGLPIVRRMAELLHHPLVLCSRVGHGSRFSLRIPLAPSPALADLPQDGGDAGAARRPILIVGGDEGGALTDQLAAWQLSAEHVADIDAGRRWIRLNGAPQFVLFDTHDGAVGILGAEAALEQMEAVARSAVPALIIGSGPVPNHKVAPGGATRLVLSRPFLPARLRALVMHLANAGEDDDSR